MPLPRPLTTLTNATLPGGRRVDVALSGDTVAAVTPARGRTAGDLDLDGFLLLTAPADPHAHLDKARTWGAIRPPMGGLGSAVEAWAAHAATITEDDVAGRARAQALAMLARGTTAVRSHVNVVSEADEPLLNMRALIRVRDELAGLVHLELVVLAGPLTCDEHVDAALDLGADLVGGAPHMADDPSADLQRLLAVARRRGTGVDLHTDESLDGPLTLGELARAVRGWTQNVTAGHCVRLGTLEPAARAHLIDEVVAARVGVVANPMTNLYLQGWEHSHLVPRGITAARELIDAGARFAAGGDNVRDPFNPLGRSDALETAMLLVVAAHLSVEQSWHAVSDGAREVMGLARAGVAVGARADLLAVRGADLAEVIACAPAARHVIHGGRLVASTTVHTEVAAPPSFVAAERCRGREVMR